MPAILSSRLLRGGMLVVAVAGALALAYFEGRSDGVASERARIAAEMEKARKERARVEGDVRRLPDDDLFDRLLRGGR